MLGCWACNYVFSSKPDEQINPEGEEELDMVATCPECMTRHVYAEDEDGNMVIIHAVKADNTLLERESA